MSGNFQLSENSFRSAKNTVFVSNIPVHIYGMDILTNSSKKITVFYFFHGRTSKHEAVEPVIHHVLFEFRNRHPEAEVIAVTFDLRNHGERMVDENLNRSWSEGNETHAIDMISQIFGTADDVIHVSQFLPSVLQAKSYHYTDFYSIVGGVSQGGHVAWRLANISGGNLFDAYCPIIGTPSLSGLMLERLGVELSEQGVDSFFGGVDYEERITDSNRLRWPRALHDLVETNDRNIASTQITKPIFSQNGELDEVVPFRYTQAWLNKQNYIKESVTQYTEHGVGHALTQSMVENLAEWICNLYPDM